jgi:hypothetical protein
MLEGMSRHQQREYQDDRHMNYEEYQRIKAEANRRAGEIAMAWLPSGHREGVQWVARNPTREDKSPGSFKVNMRTGQWADFATNQGGQSIVSLAKYLFGIPSSYAAAENLKRMLGM